jgi:hydroxyacylglutathione hydrolase
MRTGDRADLRLDVRQSGIWQTNSVVLSSDGVCLLVDPAFFPRELDELSQLAAERGRAAAVVFTHGHWDHVAGWQSFPGAEVWTSARLAEAITADDARARRDLAELRDFDGRWYIERPYPLAWPPAPRPLADGERVELGPIAIEALHIPGHSRDGLALIVPALGLLLPGDYLSPCEIPFIEDIAAYRATLRRLDDLLGGLDGVIPGHGRRLDRAAARAVIADDRVYLDALATAAEHGDAGAALAAPLPRATGVPGMRDRHLENCAAVGLRPAHRPT